MRSIPGAALLQLMHDTLLFTEKYSLDERVEKTECGNATQVSPSLVSHVLVKLIHAPPLHVSLLNHYGMKRCDQLHIKCLSTEASTSNCGLQQNVQEQVSGYCFVSGSDSCYLAEKGTAHG